MLIIALVLAVIGLAALVTAVVTSNALIAWVCIGASVIGVLLLIVDALRERSHGTESGSEEHDATPAPAEPVDYPDESEPESASDDLAEAEATGDDPVEDPKA